MYFGYKNYKTHYMMNMVNCSIILYCMFAAAATTTTTTTTTNNNNNNNNNT